MNDETSVFSDGDKVFGTGGRRYFGSCNSFVSRKDLLDDIGIDPTAFLQFRTGAFCLESQGTNVPITDSEIYMAELFCSHDAETDYCLVFFLWFTYLKKYLVFLRSFSPMSTDKIAKSSMVQLVGTERIQLEFPRLGMAMCCCYISPLPDSKGGNIR